METKNQIVYYLGAGASVQAIPIVDGLRERLSDLTLHLKKLVKIHLNEQAYSLVSEKIKNNQDYLVGIIGDLAWLHKESEYHQSIDTLAKKYYVQESRDLFRLKRALITYFFFEQNLIIPTNRELFVKDELNKFDSILDKRYDNLVASLAYRENGHILLKGHIKIITWNYDIQIEKAIKNFVDLSLNKVKTAYNIHPNMNSYDIEGITLNDIDSFAVFKLNGNAFLDTTMEMSHGGGMTPHDRTYMDFDNEEVVGFYLEAYAKVFPENKLINASAFKYFNFAWEEETSYVPKFLGHKNLIANAKEVLKNARVVIIVGYSFPYFNAEIDKEIFENCWPEQIIIQDFESEIIKSRLLEMLPGLKGPFSKDNPNIEIVFMKPNKYFPIHPLT